MYWIIGILFIFVAAFVIIKLTVDTKKNPDSNLSILDHPSTFKKPKIEFVDKSLVKQKNKDKFEKNKTLIKNNI